MKITESRLRSIIRQVIKESDPLPSSLSGKRIPGQEKIMEMVYKLKETGSLIRILDKGDQVIVMYSSKRESSGEKLMGSILCSSTQKQLAPLVGRGEDKVADSLDDVRGIGKGESRSTWYVSHTRRVSDGMGPLLYEVTMEYISSVKGAALKADPMTVSDDAHNVWRKYWDRSLKSKDIKSIRIDINKKMLDKLNDQIRGSWRLEQDSPDNPDDDAPQGSAAHHEDGYWHMSPLAWAYRKTNTDVIDELKHLDLIRMPGFGRKIKNIGRKIKTWATD